jgi:hypothetical protein
MLGSCEPASAALSKAWAASWCFKFDILLNNFAKLTYSAFLASYHSLPTVLL